MTDTVNVPVEAVAALTKHLASLNAAAIPTKCEVFVASGREAREMHDAISLLAAAPKAEPKAIGMIGHVSSGHSELSAIVAALSAHPKAPKVEQEPELKADFTRAHPSGMDDCTYSEIEDALDRKEAPVFGRLGLPLTLAQRVDALAHPAPSSEELLEVLKLVDLSLQAMADEGIIANGSWSFVTDAIAKHKGPQS